MLTSFNLRAVRRRLGITQSELAKASGYSRQAIYLIERGLRKPTEATARALTRAMEALHVAKAAVFERKAATHVDDPQSDEAGWRLRSMSTDDLLNVRVRVTPYRIEVSGQGKAVAEPMRDRYQLLDGLQAVGIVRLFTGLFKLEILPGWWTIYDDGRVDEIQLDCPELSWEQAQQRIIEEGPEE